MTIQGKQLSKVRKERDAYKKICIAQGYAINEVIDLIQRVETPGPFLETLERRLRLAQKKALAILAALRNYEDTNQKKLL